MMSLVLLLLVSHVFTLRGVGLRFLLVVAVVLQFIDFDHSCILLGREVYSVQLLAIFQQRVAAAC